MGRYFGTDGIRGRANDSLKVETVYKVGRYLGYYFSKEQMAKIVIGKDTRLSSSMFESALAAGISASGGDVYLMGYCSTPSLAYVAEADHFSCGVMISASHNPFHDNGVKVFGNNGIKIGDEIESGIEDYIDGLSEIPYAYDENVGHIFDYSQGIDEYCQWLREKYPVDLSGMRLIVDLANGSNCLIAKKVLAKTGAEVSYLSDEFDGININNDCGSTHLSKLIAAVKNGAYDLGFAFDGDADRVLFVDGEGEVVGGDQIMFLLANNLKAHGLLRNNTLVTTVMSNIGLFKALKKYNIQTDITGVGDKNVLESMLKNDFVLGGEQSGHIICTLDCNFGDGLKTALFLLSVLREEGKSLKEAVMECVDYPQLLKNIRVKDKKIVLADADITALIETITRKLGDSGRVLVRPSGTEPLIRVMVEAETAELCTQYVDEIIKLIRDKGYTFEA